MLQCAAVWLDCLPCRHVITLVSQLFWITSDPTQIVQIDYRLHSDCPSMLHTFILSTGLASCLFPPAFSLRPVLLCSVCWRAQDLLLAPNSHLTPLQVVSGTHLDINLTLLPPSPSVTTATAAAPTPTATAPPATAEASAGNRAGLVFKSWKTDGKGAAVLSFDWGSGVLMFDFDEPFPDAYNPHPEDSPERRRVGGKLRHYTAGMDIVHVKGAGVLSVDWGVLMGCTSDGLTVANRSLMPTTPTLMNCLSRGGWAAS